MKCLSMVRTSDKKTGGWLDYPCGQCIACRLRKRQEWTFRILLEMRSYQYSYFVTLTYNDEVIPEKGSLRKKDLQLFLKRLRIKYPSGS